MSRPTPCEFMSGAVQGLLHEEKLVYRCLAKYHAISVTARIFAGTMRDAYARR